MVGNCVCMCMDRMGLGSDDISIITRSTHNFLPTPTFMIISWWKCLPKPLSPLDG